MFIKYITDDHYRSPEWELQYSGLVKTEESLQLTYLLVFPNPASDILNISGMQTALDIIIYDLSGKIQFDLTSFEGGLIDISNLASGIYFLRMQNDKESQMVKFIKE